MPVLIRAATYATLFVGLVLVFVPANVARLAGVASPEALSAWQVAGMAVAALGGGLALWSVLAFARIGKGTPAPFDPPRRLVARGPYARVRNPMYIGAGLALSGAALFYRSLALLGYAAAFLLAAHAFVVFYEEPALRRTFGGEYDRYVEHAGRWWPRR